MPGSDPRPDTGCGSSPSAACPCPSSFPWHRRHLGATSGRGPVPAQGPSRCRGAPAYPVDVRDSTELLSLRVRLPRIGACGPLEASLSPANNAISRRVAAETAIHPELGRRLGALAGDLGDERGDLVGLLAAQ